LQKISTRLNHTLSKLGFNPARNGNEIANLMNKLEWINKTARYYLLFSELFKCNDVNNFKSFVVEATFAYSFEIVNLPLQYEIAQSNDHESSVDFLRKSWDGRKIYFEIRVNQQRKKTKDNIENQLKLKNMYSVSLNGTDEQEEIIRLQSNILSKTQDKNGNPVKFFTTEPGIFNIVVADITEILLGTVDKGDCMLTAYGDPYVEEPIRRNIFGLFQKPEPHYSEHILEIAKRFSQFRKTIHAILFLIRHFNSGPLDFDLSYYLVPNISLVTDSESQFLDKEIMKALIPWNDG